MDPGRGRCGKGGGRESGVEIWRQNKIVVLVVGERVGRVALVVALVVLVRKAILVVPAKEDT